MTQMEQKVVNILLVEDNVGDAFLLRDKLADNQNITFNLTHVEVLAKAVQCLQQEVFDLVFLDLNLPDSYGLKTFLTLEKIIPHIPIILLTGLVDESLALKAVREGAQDYLIKEKATTEILIRSVNYSIERMHHLEKIYQSEVSLVQANKKLIQQVENHTVELERRHQELKKLFLLATIDKVTGISNRYRLEDFLQREWGYAIRNQTFLSVIMIDIDSFKLYNDYYGHPAGDLCLRKVAQSIKNTIKRPKDLVARYGGEEFLVVLSDINLEGAMVVAENIRLQVKALAIPHQGSEHNNHLTISLGVANKIPQINCHVSSLIGAADKALYLAKQKGRDRVEMYQL